MWQAYIDDPDTMDRIQALELRDKLEEAVATIQDVQAISRKSEERLGALQAQADQALARMTSAEEKADREHQQWMQIVADSAERDALLRDFSKQVRPLHTCTSARICFEGW